MVSRFQSSVPRIDYHIFALLVSIYLLSAEAQIKGSFISLTLADVAFTEYHSSGGQKPFASGSSSGVGNRGGDGVIGPNFLDVGLSTFGCMVGRLFSAPLGEPPLSLSECSPEQNFCCGG